MIGQSAQEQVIRGWTSRETIKESRKAAHCARRSDKLGCHMRDCTSVVLLGHAAASKYKQRL